MSKSKIKQFFKPNLFKTALFISYIALSVFMIKVENESFIRCFDRAGVDCSSNIIFGLFGLIIAYPYLFMLSELNFLAYGLILLNSYIFSYLTAHLFNKFFPKQQKIKIILTTFIFLISTGYLSFIIYEYIDYQINSGFQIRKQQNIQKTEFKIADLQCTEEILPYDYINRFEFTENNQLAYATISKDESFIVFDQKEIAFDLKGVNLSSVGYSKKIYFGGYRKGKYHMETYKYQTITDQTQKFKSLRDIIEFKKNNSNTTIIHKNAELNERFQNVNTYPEFSSDGTFFAFFKAKDPWTPNIILTTCHSIN